VIVVLVPADVEVSAGEVDEEARLGFFGEDGGDADGGGAGSAGEGDAGAPFPGAHFDLVGVDNLGEMDVDALGEDGVVFD